MVAGIDNDSACEFAYTQNNHSEFHLRDVAELGSDFVSAMFPETSWHVVSGCAPCQPFSRYGRAAENRRSKWSLLGDFARIATDVAPDVVTMENVPEVALHPVFDDFVESLKSFGYHVNYDVLYCPYFGVPQRRKRLVLLASRHGQITMPRPTHSENDLPTVRSAIEATVKNAIEAIFDELQAKSIDFDSCRLEVRRVVLHNLRRRNIDSLVPAVAAIATDIVGATFRKDELFAGNVDARKIRKIAGQYGF